MLGRHWRLASLATALLALPAVASAQDGGARLQNGYDADIDLIRPMLAPENLPGLDVPANQRGGTVRWGLAAMYANSPLVLYEFDDLEVGDIVANRLSAFAGVSVDITRAFTARLTVPVHYQFGTQVPRYASEGFAFGDIHLGAHWAFYRKPAVGLGARLDMSLPTSRKKFYAGERLPRLNPAFLMMFDIGRVRIASDLGVHIRFRAVETTEDLVVGNELAWNAGVRVNILRERLDVGATVYSRFGFNNFFGAGESSAEGMLSVAYKALPILWIDLAGGRGFTRGYGASDARVWFQLRFQKVPPPRPGDPDFVDPDGGKTDADQEGLQFNVRNIGQVNAEGDGEPAEEQWDIDEFARIEADRIKIRYALQFKVGTSRLLPESYPTLDFIAELLNDDARIAHVVIEGHASEEGAFDVNYDLSVERARSIWERIVEQGVHPSRLSIRGMGEVLPAVATEGYTDLEASRRVVFHIARQYEDWEEPPVFQLNLLYPWNGEPYRAEQPRMPSPDEESALDELIERHKERDSKLDDDLTFEAPDADDLDFEDTSTDDGGDATPPPAPDTDPEETP